MGGNHLIAKFLGLDSNINWCKDVEDKLVDDLMEYIVKMVILVKKKIASLSSRESHLGALVTHSMRNPIVVFRSFTKAGLYHMEMDGKNPNKLYAWLYQIRYLFIKFISSKDKRGIFNGIKRGVKIMIL